MAEIKIEINKRLDILWYDKVYKSSVQDLSDNYVAIAAPIMGGVYLPLHKGDVFKVIYYIDEKELYEFQGSVVGRKIEGKVQLIVIEFPREFKLVQRREYVRVDVSHPVKYVKSIIASDLKLADNILDEGKGKNGNLVDISGGGFKIKTTEKMEHGNFIIIDLEMLNRKIRVTGKIIRVIKDDSDYYISGVNFIDINERTRDKIIQLIFEIMRKQRKTV